jgi:hypothetical protein
MVTIPDPKLVLRQLEARDRRKRSIDPELLEQFAEQDRRLFDLLLRYRAGEPVGEAIVGELLPAVHAKAGRISPMRLYGRDDLGQELIAEIFHTIRTIPLKRPAFLTRRLMLNAAKNLTRRLEREWHRQLDEWYRELHGGAGLTLEGDSAEDEE